MSQKKTPTIFYKGLDEFCAAYLIENPKTPPDPELLLPSLEIEKANLFEQLLLFDRLNLKVHGENVMLSVFANTFGLRAFEQLLEEDAIRFTLWTPMISHNVTEMPGIIPLQSGNFGSAPHSDPQQSIELGYQWFFNPPNIDVRRGLTRKLLKAYEKPPQDLSANVVSRTLSSYNSGKMANIGFDVRKPVDQLTLPERAALGEYANKVLEYSYLVSQNMTSFSDYNFFTLLRETALKVAPVDVRSNYAKVAKLENFPDFQALLKQIDHPFQVLPKLRKRKNIVKFRRWLASTTLTDHEGGVTKEYIEAMEEAQGFFETKAGKFVKAIGLTSIGGLVGLASDGADGAVAGVAIAKALELAGHFAIDLVDECVLEGLTKGWSPRMYFNELDRVRTPPRIEPKL